MAETGVAEAEDVDSGEPDQRERFGSLGSILHVLVLAWAVFLGTLPLNDNSFFTHLATGRIILDDGRVPTTDPYTFTAQGEPWTVQSWLMSVQYAGAERFGGDVAIRLLVTVLLAVAASLLWRLSRPCESLLLRVVLVAMAMVVASGAWSERPYMIGAIGLSVVLLALAGSGPPWVLVPLLWVWGNSHGSFPLALALCVATIAGAHLDGDRRQALGVELRVTGAVALGAMLAVASPLGLDALLFPLRAVTDTSSFAQIVEWQAPALTSASDRAFLLLVLLAVAALVRVQRWRLALPALLFIAAALVARRNIVMALPVLVAVAAAGAPSLGSLRAVDRPTLGRPLVLVAAVLPVLIAVVSLGGPGLGLGAYPTRALAWVPADGGRTATQDFTGNLLEVLDGPVGQVFVDDRVDMLPPDLVDDVVTLNRGGGEWDSVLDDRGIDVVVWRSDDPLGSLLAASSEWRTAYSDADWTVAARR